MNNLVNYEKESPLFFEYLKDVTFRYIEINCNYKFTQHWEGWTALFTILIVRTNISDKNLHESNFLIINLQSI